MKQYLFSDLDGTLLFDQSDGSYDISPADLQALCVLPQHNIELVLASGRACNAAVFVKERLGYSVDMIALNGAMLLCKGREEQITGLPVRDYRMITEDIAAHFPQVSMGTLHFDGNYYMKEPMLEDYIGRLRRHQLHDHAYGMQNDDHLVNGDEDRLIPKILFYVKRLSDPDQVYRYLQDHYGDRYDFLFSSTAIVECLPKGISMAIGIQRYMKEHQLTEAQCWAVGDSDNDVEMLKLFANSCCMRHGTAAAKKAAATTVENVKEAIEKMIG